MVNRCNDGFGWCTGMFFVFCVVLYLLATYMSILACFLRLQQVDKKRLQNFMNDMLKVSCVKVCEFYRVVELFY